MKILTVVTNLEKGGTQRAAQTFAEAYKILGHDSKLLALYGLGPRYDEIKDFIEIWNGLDDENLNKLKKWAPDIVHIHSHGPKLEDINKLIHICPKAKIIETNVFSRPSLWAKSVFISFQLSEWAQWLFNLRSNKNYKSTIVPYPIKCDAFKRVSQTDIFHFKKEHKIPEEAFVIGRIGQALKGKWSTQIIETFNEVSIKIPNTYLLLVNPPENILEAAQNSPFSNKVVHIPKIFGDRNLSFAYSAMDVMLLIAEQGESFGIVLTESILCETPVVTLNTPWADNSQGEVIGNLKGGFVLNNKKNLSKTIVDLFEGKLKYNPVVGINHIHKYDYIKVANSILDFVNEKQKPISSKRKSISNQLKDSMDNPNFLTLFFIKLNRDFFRKLTIYTTGYKGLSEMAKSSFAYFKRRIP